MERVVLGLLAGAIRIMPRPVGIVAWFDRPNAHRRTK